MADKNEPVVLIGLGRFGTAVAVELTRRGIEVLAIDSSPKRVQSLAGRLTQVVTADCTDVEALRQLGVPDFYRAVVAIGSDIEASILVTSLLIELEIDDVWAKAISDHHGRILRRVGAHHVVYPEVEMGERVAHLVSGRMLDYMSVDEDFALAKIHPPREVIGVPSAIRESAASTASPSSRSRAPTAPSPTPATTPPSATTTSSSWSGAKRTSSTSSTSHDPDDSGQGRWRGTARRRRFRPVHRARTARSYDRATCPTGVQHASAAEAPARARLRPRPARPSARATFDRPTTVGRRGDLVRQRRQPARRELPRCAGPAGRSPWRPARAAAWATRRGHRRRADPRAPHARRHQTEAARSCVLQSPCSAAGRPVSRVPLPAESEQPSRSRQCSIVSAGW